MHSSNNSSPAKHQSKGLHQQKLLERKTADALGKSVKHKTPSAVSCNDSAGLKLGSGQELSSNNLVNSDLVKRNSLDNDSCPKRIKPNSSSRKSSDESEDSSKSSLLKTFECKFCSRQLKSEEQLQKHFQIYHTKAAHVCYVCNYQTLSFSALMNHYVKHSGQNGINIDKFLEKSIRYTKSINRDISSSVNHSFSCQNCKLSFASKLKLDAHKCPNSLLKKEYKCTYCGRSFATVEEYRDCVQSHTESPYVCPLCQGKFTKYKQFCLHVRGCKENRTAVKGMKCENCKDFSCSNPKELQIHQKKCKSVETFVCKDCNLEFSGKECFEEHLDFCEPEYREKSPPSKAKLLPKATRKYVRKKPRYVCDSCDAPFFLKAEYVRHGKNCIKVPSFDANENASRACSKCGSLIPIGKLAQHSKECSKKQQVEENCAENDKNMCFDTGNELKEPEAIKLPSSSHQNDGENKCELKPKRKFKKKLTPNSEKNHQNNVEQDNNETEKHKLESDPDSKPKQKNKKKMTLNPNENLNDGQGKEKKTVSHVEMDCEISKNAETESNVCQQDNNSEIKSKPKGRQRRKIIVLEKDFKENEQDIDALKISDIEPNCEMNKNVIADDNIEARRSRRKICRKNSFMDEGDEEILRKTPKTIGLKLTKKPRITIKPKFRRGKYTNGSSKSFLCSVCDFAFCSKSTLLRHKRMHSGDPWYTCKYCGKFFFRKDVYVRHETNVHKESEKTVYCCCYCKLCFCNTSGLKKHAMEVHKASAFLPHKPKILVKSEVEEADIKLESAEVSEDKGPKSNDSEPDGKTDKNVVSSDCLFKCSVCSETFETVSSAGNHMATHSMSEIVEESNASECDGKGEVSCVKDSPKASSSKVSKEPVHKSASNAVPLNLQEGDQNLEKSSENVQEDSADHELLPDENMIQVDSYEKLECLLCKQKFTDETLFEAHKKSDHKLVEWYQCLVCSASGAKQDMVEHMFSHMYKVGSFIVNCNAKSLESLLPCLELNKLSISTEKESKAVTEEIDSVSDHELPPLREFGVCSCIENVSNTTEVVDYISETELNMESVVLDENLDSTSPCSSPVGENVFELETNIALSHNDSAKISESDLQSKSNMPEMIIMSENEGKEDSGSEEVQSKTQEVPAESVLTCVSLTKTMGSDQSSPMEAQLDAKSDPLKDDIGDEEIDLSPSSDNKEPNNDVSNLLNVPLEKEIIENEAVYSSDASSSDRNSVASSSSSVSEEDEANRSDSSSSDSSSEDNDSEDDDSSSSASSSVEEEDSVHASSESSHLKEVPVAAVSVSLDEQDLKAPDASLISLNREMSVHEENKDKSLNNPKSSASVNLSSASTFSQDSTPFVGDPLSCIASSQSESREIVLDFQPPFGQKRPIKTNSVKQTSSSTNSEAGSHLNASQLTEQITDLTKSNPTSSIDVASKKDELLASTCSTVSNQINTMNVQPSFGQDMMRTDPTRTLVSSSSSVTMSETPRPVFQSSENNKESSESNFRLLKEPAPSVIKSLASTVNSSSNKRETVDLQSCFKQKPFILKPGTSSFLTTKTEHHNELQSSTQDLGQPKSDVVVRDPVSNKNEKLVSSSCFNSEINRDISSAPAKRRPCEQNTSKPIVSSTTSNKMGSHLSVFQLTEKMPELFKPNITSKSAVGRMSKPSATTASPKNNSSSFQTTFNQKEFASINLSKHVSPCPGINDSQRNSADLEPTDRVLESLKSVISPQTTDSKSMPLSLTPNPADSKIEKQNFHVLPSNKGSKTPSVSPSKYQSQLNMQSACKEPTLPATSLPAKIKSMKNPEIKVITSHSSQASELPLNLQKSPPVSNYSPGSFSQLRSLLQKPTKMDSEKITLYPASFTNSNSKQASSNSSRVNSEKITLYPASYTEPSLKQGSSDSSKMDSDKITLYPASYTESSLKPGVSNPSKEVSEKITLYPASHMDLGVQQGVSNFSKINSEKITLYPASYTDPSMKLRAQDLSKSDSEKITIYPAFTDSNVKQVSSNVSKVESEKITIYPLSYTDSSVKQDDSAPFVKCISSIGNSDLFNSSFMLDDKCDYTVPSQPILSSDQTKTELTTPSHSGQVTSQSLDLSQPRGVVPGNQMTFLPPKPPEKCDNFFKPCLSQSPILDFSDLIQHSFDNPNPSDENIFSFPETVKTNDLYQCHEQIRTSDCTTNPSFSSPAFGVNFNCHNCNAVFLSNDQLANHKCLLPEVGKPVGLTFLNQPKSTFQSPGFAGSQTQVSSLSGHSQPGKHVLPPRRAAETFGSTKALPSDLRLKSSPHQNVHAVSSSSPKCNKCQAVFSDIGELMKHSLSCLKPLFSRNPQSGECMNAPGTMQPVTNFANFAFGSALPITTMPPGSTPTYTNFQNTKHPFNS